MALTSTIVHEAVVTHILPDSGEMYVSVADTGAEDCSSCAAAALCRRGKGGELKVKMPADRSFTPGMRVRIQAGSALHRRAVTLMLVLPCLMLMLPLVALSIAGVREWIAGFAGLASCSLTYWVLWRCRKQLSGGLSFSVADDD